MLELECRMPPTNLCKAMIGAFTSMHWNSHSVLGSALPYLLLIRP